ncbi:MAG: hypothetical protein HYZ57_13330 [Acidobacteria bacterium]|nr:hypothetical protein [Acidobacteriota bacterium]MBI3280814.1 hypothetical protein [Acidobacteriota bacterium]
MTARHSTDDELIERLYGLRTADDHSKHCAGCAARLAAMARRKSLAARPPDLSPAFLAGQRAALEARIARPGWFPSWRAMSLLTGATAVLAAILIFRPVPRNPQPRQVSDAQLFADIYTAVQDVEPRAAEPIHALFAEQK